MIDFLYYTFLYQYQIGNTELSYTKIKRVLSNSVSDFQSADKNISAFYELLKYGLIDVYEKDKYSLTQSCIFSNTRSNYSLGINIPESVIENFKNYKITSRLGLTIFYNLPLDEINTELIHIVFDFKSYTNNYSSVNKVIKNWKAIKKEEIGQYISLEYYDFQFNKWIKTQTIEGEYSLFKKYTVNDYFYSYLFKYGNNFFDISIGETEKIRMLTIGNPDSKFIQYKPSSKEVVLISYFNYPNFLYKTFFITHILNTGTFPSENKFTVDQNDFLHIIKKLKLNYKML